VPFGFAFSPPSTTLGQRLSAVCLVLCAWLWSLSAHAADILLVAAEDSASVQSFTRALSQLRPADNVRFQPLSSLPSPTRLDSATRLVLLDLPSFEWRLQDSAGPPTLVLRISRLQARQHLSVTLPARLTLLWSDPSPIRQLRLIQALMPQVRKIGVLYDDHSEFLLSELQLAALSLNLEIVAEPWINTNDSRPLQTLLNNSDVLLGLDDPDLYNPKTAKNLLLSSYSRQVPLVGPNASFVRAGSLVSSYSDQNDWLNVLDTLLDMPTANWPRSHYPAHFKVLSNPQVARSLGIEPIDEAELATRLAEGENRP